MQHKTIHFADMCVQVMAVSRQNIEYNCYVRVCYTPWDVVHYKVSRLRLCKMRELKYYVEHKAPQDVYV